MPIVQKSAESELVRAKTNLLNSLNFPGILYIAWIPKYGWLKARSKSMPSWTPQGLFPSREQLEDALKYIDNTSPEILEISLADILHSDIMRIYHLDRNLFSQEEIIQMLKNKIQQLFHTEIFSKRFEDGKLVRK